MFDKAQTKTFEKAESNIILFIPFSAKENNLDLYMRAFMWQSNMRAGGKLDKVPKIVMYRREDESDDDYSDFGGVHFKFDKSLVSPGTEIYILADGMGDPHLLLNTNDISEENFILPIELIANRAKEIGLNPELAASCRTIKLFCCEEFNNSNEKMAKNFAFALGKEYENLKIDFYTGKVSIPMKIQNLKNKHLMNFDLTKHNQDEVKKRAITPDNQYLGFASKNKKTISVKQVLEESEYHPVYDIATFIEQNKAAVYQIQNTVALDSNFESKIEAESEDSIDSHSDFSRLTLLEEQLPRIVKVDSFEDDEPRFTKIASFEGTPVHTPKLNKRRSLEVQEHPRIFRVASYDDSSEPETLQSTPQSPIVQTKKFEEESVKSPFKKPSVTDSPSVGKKVITVVSYEIDEETPSPLAEHDPKQQNSKVSGIGLERKKPIQ